MFIKKKTFYVCGSVVLALVLRLSSPFILSHPLVPRLSCLISRLGSFSLLGARYLLDDDRPPLPLQPSLRPVF